MKIRKIKYKRIILNLSVIGLLGVLFCCSGTKTIAITGTVPKEVNYIPYYLKVYEVQDFFREGNYERSFEILDSLFKVYKPLNQFMGQEYLIYLKSAYMTSNYQILKNAFLTGIEDYGLSDFLFENDSLLGLAFQYTKIDSQTYNDYWNKYVSKLNLSLRDTIKEMRIRDQYNSRKGYNTYEGMKILDSTDLINEKLLIYIFEKYGYPNESLVGNMEFSIKRDSTPFSSYFPPILLHTRDSIRQAYFIPKMWEYVKEGKAPPLFYARMVDQLEIYNKRPQIYGTYSKVDIKDKRKVDSLRNTIGLPNL